ncbi:tetratricopeptide repeat protein [Mucilaginibacter mali]|uniref:histidine kinase n=1 Tax=Mucilaginibacter mali TaxID=2740462 RepID=A0A7D4TV32_9SPHI|nr:histidine kinase dimerization/phospho-acceptor domain-containing protein [Mucilaginibacter mali]QKJ30235.1 tetratricopeptide repeat protein [Mucilaginibacter mali]
MPVKKYQPIFWFKAICVSIAAFLIYTLVLAPHLQEPKAPWIPQAQLGKMFSLADAKIAKYGPRKAIYVADSLCKAKNLHGDQVNMLLYSHYAFYYQLLNVRDSAILFADSAISIADRHPMADTNWLRYSFSNHFNKGNLLYAFGRVQPAVDEFFKAKDKVEKAGEECHAFQIYHLIGLVMYRQQQYNAAKSYFIRTMQIFDKCSVPGRVYNYDHLRQEMLNNIAQCYENLARYDSARIYCQKALAQVRRSENAGAYDTTTGNLNRGVVYGTIAQIFNKTGHTDSSEVFYKKSLQFTNKPNGDISDAQLTQVNLAGLYLNEKQSPKLKNTLDSLSISLKKHYNEDALLGWNRLMYQYASVNRMKLQELNYYKQYISMRDSIAEAKREQMETDLNEALNARSQRLEISLLKKDNQLGKIYLWIVLSLSFLAVVIIALVLFNYRRSRRNVKVLTDLNDQISRQKNALEQANRNKDRILSVVAHDLRSPVGATIYLADLMMMEDDFDARLAPSLGLMKQTSQDALELINELLDLHANNDELVKGAC